MTKEFCDICEIELIPAKDFSDNTPVSFDYGTTHCLENSRSEIFGRVCLKCEVRIIKSIKDTADKIRLKQ